MLNLQINCFKILDKLAPWLFDLVQWNPDKSSVGLIEVIKEKYKDFLKNSRSYPSLDTVSKYVDKGLDENQSWSN